MAGASTRSASAKARRPKRRAGTIAIVGRPNVGKSTLLNAMLGERIAITSHHPQTTRDRIAGILTTPTTQFVFQDTPGLHAPRNRLGKRMNDVAHATVGACDVILFVTDVSRNATPEVNPGDLEVLRTIPSGRPVILVLNKIDKVEEKPKLIDILAAYGAAHDFAAIVPISARKKDGVDRLLGVIDPLLPEGEPLYPEDDISDRPVRFFVAELVREQVLARTREEVPHGVAVTVDAFDEPAGMSTSAKSVKKDITRITLSIHVAKDSHKGIIIGKGGKMLESIGTIARERAEKLLGRRVHLDVRVKATPGWFDDAGRLADLGYADEETAKAPPKETRWSSTMTKHHPMRALRALPAGSHGLPRVAVVGRPNVGKSTLFNRLARRRLAIVHDEPGVTRDRHYVDTTAFGRDYTLVDTGGFDPDSDDPMKSGIARHVQAAIAEADVIVFIADAMVPLTSADRLCVKLLRKAGKPAIFAANKADSPKFDADAFELYRLGVETVIPISALHGRGIGDLEAAIVAALPPQAEDPLLDETVVRVTVVGKPNAGKSSLLNRVLGEDRMLVDPRPGTTRDAIDSLVERGDKRYVFIDTAGLRRKGKVTKASDAIEVASISSAVAAIERSHVVVLLCDANEGVAEQDAKILGLANDRGRGMVIGLNKVDLMEKTALKKAETDAREKISFAPFVPVVELSAKTGRGVGSLFGQIDKVGAAFHSRVSTGELNRFFEQVLEIRPPPTMGGRAPRLYYITQAETSPPLFVVIASSPDSVHFSYQRFVLNQLRKHFGFEGVPIRVVYREKRRGKRKVPGEEPS